MTIGAVVKLRKCIVALTDGRLSRGESVSFDTAEKIAVVQPGYLYPLASIGTQERTQFCRRYRWCLLYAGTYVLASEIREEFRRQVTSFLVDQTADGVQFVDQFPGRHRRDPFFHISRYDLPKLPGKLVVEALKYAYELKATEWRYKRSEHPDAEFLLFGTDDETEDYKAARITFDINLSPFGQPVVASIESIDDMSVYAIGSKALCAEIENDPTLHAAIAASVPPPSLGVTLHDFLDEMQPSETIDVVRRLIKISRSGSDDSVGGDMRIAVGDASHNIRVFKIDEKGCTQLVTMGG